MRLSKNAAAPPIPSGRSYRTPELTAINSAAAVFVFRLRVQPFLFLYFFLTFTTSNFKCEISAVLPL